MKKIPNTLSTLLILSFLLCSFSLFAAELVYEPASGKNYGFDLSLADSPDLPTSYVNTNDIWRTKADGYVGRLRYQGPETILTFTQTDPIATGTSNNMFYFTYLTDGFSRVDVWREYFIVTTVKGLLHNGEQDTFVGSNNPINHNGGTVSIAVSSGPETWERYKSGIHPGYSSNGTPGPKTWGSDVFKYKHKYQYTWVDIVIIKRNQTQPAVLPIGKYTSRFIAQTTEGLSQPFALFGENNSGGSVYNFFFEVASVVPKFFPFEMLKNKNTVQNSLHVANLTYYSTSDAANLRIASNAIGSEAQFKLYSPGVPPIPFNVVFTSTVPQKPQVHVTSPQTKFLSLNKTDNSPIDGQPIRGNYLEGKVGIFVSPNIMPMSGSYSGSIFCIITQQ